MSVKDGRGECPSPAPQSEREPDLRARTSGTPRHAKARRAASSAELPRSASAADPRLPRALGVAYKSGVIGPVWARWVALHLLRRPWIWLTGLLAAGLWALTATLGPVGIGTDPSLLQRAHGQLAFLGLLIGTALATHLLSRAEWLLARTSARRRLGARAWALGAGAALGWIATATLPLATGSPWESLELLVPTLFAGLHLCALALVLLELPLSAAGRSILLLGTAGLAPAILQGSGRGADWLARLLDASRSLGAELHSHDPHLGESSVPILAWILVAILLATPPNAIRPGSSHALRHPR